MEDTFDSVVTAVINGFKNRARIGKAKYGTDLDRKDLKVGDWIQHAQEELMDGILYLEKLKQETTEECWKCAGTGTSSKNVICKPCNGTGRDLI